MKLKNDLHYLWLYYKWQIFAAAVVVILVIHFIIQAFSSKECVLSVMLFDCHTEVRQEKMEKELLQALQLEEKKYTVTIQNNLMLDNTESGSYAMTSLSRFLSDIGSEKLDVCGMLEDTFLKYEESGTFLDLRECIPQEYLENWEEALVITKDNRVMGLYADKLPGMQKDACYNSKDMRGVIGIVYNTKHLEAAVDYLIYLAEMPE